MQPDEAMADPDHAPRGGGGAAAADGGEPDAQQRPQQGEQPQAGQPQPQQQQQQQGEDAAAERSGSRSDRRAEVYTIEFDSLVYSLAWSVRPDKPFRLAVGTFKEDTTNTVEIMQLDEELGSFRRDAALRFSHPYPPTKLLFCPDADLSRPDLLASTGDHLRVWRVDAGGVSLDRLLTNNKNSEFCAPLTSFDWNDHDPKRLGTSSIDTTCTIWDIERGVVDTQLIAHDREVYDIAWGGVAIFATVSADGSVRVFDLRDKEHSTIIYESPRPDTPLLRLSWNKQDPRYLATFPMESTEVIVLDIRYPTVPIAELSRHHGYINALSWAPHSSCHICTVGDDAQALIWDLSSIGQQAAAPWQPSGAAGAGAGAAGAAGAAGGGGGGDALSGLDPILSYSARSDINQLQWSAAHPDWIAINYGATTEVLRV